MGASILYIYFVFNYHVEWMFFSYYYCLLLVLNWHYCTRISSFSYCLDVSGDIYICSALVATTERRAVIHHFLVDLSRQKFNCKSEAQLNWIQLNWNLQVMKYILHVIYIFKKRSFISKTILLYQLHERRGLVFFQIILSHLVWVILSQCSSQLLQTCVQ